MKCTSFFWQKWTIKGSGRIEKLKMIGQKLGTFLLGFWNKIKMMEGFSIKQSKHVQRQIQVKKALILCPLQFRWVSSTYIYHPPETKENNNDRVMHFLKGLALYVLAALLRQNIYEIALQFIFNSKLMRVAYSTFCRFFPNFLNSCYEIGI